MAKVKAVLKVVLKLIQILGIGLGTAAVTDPSALEGLIPAEHVGTLAGAAAIVNAFLPSVTARNQKPDA